MRARAAATAVALAALCACGGESARVRVHQRLVEPAGPVATIADETRPVLRGYPSGFLLRDRDVRASGGRIVRRVPLPQPLAPARRVVLSARLRVDGQWRARSYAALPVRGAGAERYVEIDVAAPSAERLELRLDASVPPDSPETLYETPPIAIPARAALDLGIGVLEPAWEQGAVAFTLAACEAGECQEIFAETLDPAAPSRGRWRDRRLPLDAWAGRRVALRFRTRQLEPSGGGYGLPVWSDPVVVAPVQDAGPDLIAICIDTLRADHLTSYGHARDTAPFVDSELAARGVLFERAYSAASATGPSHMTLFTSLAPSAHGLRGNVGFSALPAGAVTLAESLRAGGFATAAITEGGPLYAASGFARGFGVYVEERDPADPTPGRVKQTLARGLEWLERHRDRRAFLFLHSYQVHTPYDPPAAYAALFPEPLPGVPRPPVLPESWSPDRYDREIRFVDDALRDFFAELSRRGLAENAVFVLLSDHGEGFLEHGRLAHGAIAHDEVLRVPLILRGPGIPAGRRVGAPVGLVDLMPTLLELMGLPVPDTAQGRSFAALVRGEPAGAAWSERPLFSEAWADSTWGPGGAPHKVPRPSFAVRIGDRKLIRFRTADGHRYAYYDLARDPGERRDLYAAEPEAAADLRALIDAYEARERARFAALSGGEAEPAEPEGSATLEAEREAQLRALGYLE